MCVTVDASTGPAWQTGLERAIGSPPRPARKKWFPMCSPVRCRTCGKITWSGCGDHVDRSGAMVPDDLWCPGHDEDPGGNAPQGFFQRLGR